MLTINEDDLIKIIDRNGEEHVTCGSDILDAFVVMYAAYEDTCSDWVDIAIEEAGRGKE